LKDINEVTLKTGNVSPFAVIVPAVIVGGLAGSVIGGALCDPGPTHSFEEASGKFFMKLAGYVLGTLIGAVAGGIGGVVIINAINYETLDLFSVSEKNKKNKLIKFLRQKKN
jgi:outer membrane lipoprotein SlyB